MTWLAVFLGGGIGAVIRYLISVYTYKPNSGFPLATFLANILACVLLSIILLSWKDVDPKTKLFLATGLCGGLSTFSTFSYETFDLIQSGQIGTSVLYVFLSIFCCTAIFFCVWWLVGR